MQVVTQVSRPRGGRHRLAAGLCGRPAGAGV
jgi:hypothetical protein